MAEEEDEGADGRTDLLLLGPETVIFARPGDEDVDGDEAVDEMDLAACPPGGRCGGEEAGDHFSLSSLALLLSFPGCWDTCIPPMESVFFTETTVVEVLSSST